MSGFCCPVCRLPLVRKAGSLLCENGHNFDVSKHGYVNLLRSNRSAQKRHGDDLLMVRARRDFLNSGGYATLRDRICALTVQAIKSNAVLLDAGCGEGYYTAAVDAALRANGAAAEMLGVDISKDALRYAAKRLPSASFAVASLFSLPLADASVDAVLHLFAPEAGDEFLRVLRPGGILLRVVPLEEHLYALKAAIYEKPYRNTVPEAALPGFRLRAEEALRERLRLTDPKQIADLFRMTPYYYKTSRADQAKLSALDCFETELAFGIRIYEKE